MISAPPSVDPNKTIMGTGPSLHATVDATMTIKPVQCPVCKTFCPAGMLFCMECGLILDRALDGDAFGAPTVVLPVLVDEGGKEFILRPGLNVLGRQGDLEFNDPRVSRRHAQITLEGATVWIEDLGSTNGTSVNGQPVSGTKMALNHGEVVSLGGLKLTVSLPGEAIKTNIPQSGKTQAIFAPPTTSTKVGTLRSDESEHDLHAGTNTFGRKEECDVQLDNKFVSGRHGEIEIADDGVYLTDVGSTNGTILNETKLTANQRVKLQPGDVIRLGGVDYRVETP